MRQRAAESTIPQPRHSDAATACRTAIGLEVTGSSVRGGPVDLVTGAAAGRRLTRSFPDDGTAALDRTIHEVTTALGAPGPTGLAFADLPDRDDIHAGDLGPRFVRSDAAAIAETRYGAGMGRSGLIVMMLFDRDIELSLVEDGRLIDSSELTAQADRSLLVDNTMAAGRQAPTLTEWGHHAHRYLSFVERVLHPDLFIVDTTRGPTALGLWLHLFRTRTPQVMANLGTESVIVGAAALAADAAYDAVG